jgi:hypothetical protein
MKMQVFTVWTYTTQTATDKSTTLFLQHYFHFLNPLLKKIHIFGRRNAERNPGSIAASLDMALPPILCRQFLLASLYLPLRE